MPSVRSFLVLLAFAALPAAATECGVGHKQLMAAFAGHWRSEDGDLYDIAPGKVDRTSVVHLAAGDRTEQSRYHLVKVSDGEDPSASVLDCRDLTETERQKIEGDLVILADATAVPDSEMDRANRQDIAQFRAALVRPPYRMLAFTHYEDRQWLILLSPDRLLDVWYGEGLFSVELYKRSASTSRAKAGED